MIKILGRANSVNVQKAMWCAAELGLKVERTDIGGAFGGTDTVEYGALNPNRKIPVLIDGDFTLWESNTIVRYLCAQYGDANWRLPTAASQAHADQWMDWYLTTLHPPMTTLFWALIRTEPAKQDQAKIAQAINDSAAQWAILDRLLANQPYILGDTLSMADIPVGCSAYRWHCMDITRPDLPNLRRWWNSLTARPSYKTNVMVPLT